MDQSEETEALQKVVAAQRLTSEGGLARFDLDHSSGSVFVQIHDAESGEIVLRLSPEEVAEGLRELEEDDGHQTLHRLFVERDSKELQ